MNKERLVIGLILFCNLGICFSQHVPNKLGISGLILSADSIKDKEEANSYLRNMEHEVRLLHNDAPSLSLSYYNMAICYAAINLLDSACYFANKVLDHSCNYNDLIYSNNDFENLRDQPCWAKTIQRIDSCLLLEGLQIENKELAIDLYHIYLRDQYVRRYEIMKKADRSINIDSVNLVRVEEIIKIYGWPSYSLVGRTASMGAFLVIQHANVQVQQKYLKAVFDAAMINEASKEWVALLMDRISLVKKGVQIFGTQVYQVRDSITTKDIRYSYFPIRDEFQVDSLRNAFDMIPLKEYYAKYGIDYNPSQK